MGAYKYLREQSVVDRMRDVVPKAEHYHPLLVELLALKQERIKELEAEVSELRYALLEAKAFNRDATVRSFSERYPRKGR